LKIYKEFNEQGSPLKADTAPATVFGDESQKMPLSNRQGGRPGKRMIRKSGNLL
jgi:hypothetical protein